jgi:hypothetical protein
VAAGNPRASGTDCRYFHESGHYACGEFLSFFNTWGGLEVFGYPLSEAFHDPAHGGLYVQYFQRARMEWHGANPDPYKVEVGLLADELGYSFPPARPEQIPPSNGSLHRYFPETRHVASYAFLDYFREHGGLQIFGYPRSEFMYEGGHVVQYFQRMRMEWHPERAVGSQMLLANLGEVYIERFGVPGNYLDPVQPPSAPGESVTNASDAGDADTNPYQTVTRLSASASVPRRSRGDRERRRSMSTSQISNTTRWLEPP